MWYSIVGIVLSFIGTAFSLWKILMRDERIAGTWRDIPNLHRNAVQERRYVMAGIADSRLFPALACTCKAGSVPTVPLSTGPLPNFPTRTTPSC